MIDTDYVFDLLAVLDRAVSLADAAAAEKWGIVQDVSHDDVMKFVPGGA